MKYFPMVWSMLWRSRARTTLTFLSIVAAFLLFGLLNAVTSAFDAGVRMAGDDRLIVTYRQGLTNMLPYAYRDRIAAVDGVRAVGPTMWLAGWYQDPKNQAPAIAVDADLLLELDPRLTVAPDHLQAFRRTRASALAGRDLVEKYGWRIGDRIPLTIGIARKDGSQDWAFELVGTYTFDPDLVGTSVAAMNLLVRFDYYNEATQWPDHVLWYTVRIHDAQQAGAVIQAIDALFANSSHETRTQTEQDFTMGFVRQIGDVGLIVSAILAAVFFTLILVAGNAMMQAFRERVPELAVLKTLGFTDRRVAALVATESLLLCVAAGASGLGLAMLIVPRLRQALAQFLPALGIEPATLVGGMALAVAVGALAAVIPVWKAARLTVIEALSAE